MSPVPRLLAAGAVALLLGAAAACGGSSHPAAGAPTSSARVDGPSVPAATSSEPAPATALLALLAPAPTGFTKSTDSNDANGTIGVSQFEQLAGTGAAAKFHFQEGAVVTYLGSTQLPNEVIYQLLRFSSAADAQAAMAGATAQESSALITTGTDGDIPGSVTLSPKSAPTDGSLADYSVVATRGAVLMFADLYTQQTDPAYVTDAQQFATTQYRRLP